MTEELDMFKIRTIILSVATMVFAANSLADECSDVQFGGDLQNRYPKINEACLGILDYHGDQYVRLSGKIVSSSNRFVTLRWQRPDGSYINDIFRTKRLDPAFRLNIGGKNVRPSSLLRGQEINTYVMLGGEIATLMSDADDLETITLTAMAVDFDPAPVEMPTTASILPTLGLLGVLSLGIGGLIRIFRKRV
jgi:hypothetical protein